MMVIGVFYSLELIEWWNLLEKKLKVVAKRNNSFPTYSAIPIRIDSFN